MPNFDVSHGQGLPAEKETTTQYFAAEEEIWDLREKLDAGNNDSIDRQATEFLSANSSSDQLDVLKEGE